MKKDRFTDNEGSNISSNKSLIQKSTPQASFNTGKIHYVEGGETRKSGLGAKPGGAQPGGAKPGSRRGPNPEGRNPDFRRGAKPGGA